MSDGLGPPDWCLDLSPSADVVHQSRTRSLLPEADPIEAGPGALDDPKRRAFAYPASGEVFKRRVAKGHS